MGKIIAQCVNVAAHRFIIDQPQTSQGCKDCGYPVRYYADRSSYTAEPESAKEAKESKVTIGQAQQVLQLDDLNGILLALIAHHGLDDVLSTLDSLQATSAELPPGSG